MILFTSILIWLFETGKYWFLMHAFAFTVSFFALMLMNGIANLVTIIPSAPGYIGTFEAAGVAVLQAYGVDKAIASAYTVVLHAALWLPITILGAMFCCAMGSRCRRCARGAGGSKSGKHGGIVQLLPARPILRRNKSTGLKLKPVLCISIRGSSHPRQLFYSLQTRGTEV